MSSYFSGLAPLSLLSNDVHGSNTATGHTAAQASTAHGIVSIETIPVSQLTDRVQIVDHTAILPNDVHASLCGYTEYENLDLLIISAGTLSIYQNEIPLEEFLRHTPDIPMILTETDRAPKRGITLIADNTQGIAGCVEHLIEVHGLTRIGYITGPKNNQDAEKRFIVTKNTNMAY